jgi:hypothetical protein
MKPASATSSNTSPTARRARPLLASEGDARHGRLPQAHARARRDHAGGRRCTPPIAGRGRLQSRAGHAGRSRDEGAGRGGDARGRARMARSRTSCSVRCCRAIPTTSATCSWKSAPAPAATNRRCSPATCSACIRATPSASAGRSRSSRSESDLGGYKEVIAAHRRHGRILKLKFESGGHRVQRVPVTERRAASTPRPARWP